MSSISKCIFGLALLVSQLFINPITLIYFHDIQLSWFNSLCLLILNFALLVIAYNLVRRARLSSALLHYQLAKISGYFIYCLVIFLLLNWIVLCIYQSAISLRTSDAITLSRQQSNPMFRAYGDRLYSVYPTWNKSDVDDLLIETWSRPVEYDAYVNFREGTYSGKYINVSKDGYRLLKRQNPFPPSDDKTIILVFGGSTTFGYGVADSESIPSYMQDQLEDKAAGTFAVYNFGRGYYFSSQERVLLQNLLQQLSPIGNKKIIATFIDGINDYDPRNLPDLPEFSNYFRDVLKPSANLAELYKQALSPLPIMQVLQEWRKLALAQQPAFAPDARNAEHHLCALADTEFYQELDNIQSRLDVTIINQMTKRYLFNIKLTQSICDAFNISCIFVQQPVPTYHFKRQQNPLGCGEVQESHSYKRMGYEQLLNNKSALGKNNLWLADLQLSLPDSPALYCDGLHYSAFMNQAIAKELADAVIATTRVQ